MKISEANHFIICKHETQEDKGYKLLIECINEVVKEYWSRRIVALDKKPIGIDDTIQDLRAKLAKREVSIVGLFGPGVLERRH